MTRALRIVALLALVCLLGGGQLAHGQDATEAEQLSSRSELDVVTLGSRMFELCRATARLSELGIRGTTREEIDLGSAGRYIRADQFRLERDTGAVEATGNVIMTTIPDDGGPAVTIRANRMTINEGF